MLSSAKPRAFSASDLRFAAASCRAASVGRVREARIINERAVSANPLDRQPQVASAFLAAWLGNLEAARHQFDNLQGKARDFDVDFYRFWDELWFGDPAIAKAIHERIKGEGASVGGSPACVALFVDSSHDYLFFPPLRLVRADARFMPLAARLGLVDYWLDTGHWPDFCTTEQLPYDCKEAALAARSGEISRRAAP